ncbi:MAG: hypothetical protein AB7I24_13220 [Candidatus Nanopelagicales bacterium]
MTVSTARLRTALLSAVPGAALVAGLLMPATVASAAVLPPADGVITAIDEFVLEPPIGDCCGPGSDPMDYGVWSPDGARMAMISADSRLVILDAVAKKLYPRGNVALDLQSRPSWNPQGNGVAVASGGDIIVLSAATGSISRNLTSTPAITERNPTWSPSRIIAFETPAGVYAVGDTGGTPVLRVAGASHPRFSPDGKHLAYLKAGHLFYSKPDGTGEVDANLDVVDFDWSPDSTRFVALMSDATGWGSTDTWVTTLTGAGVRPVASPGSSAKSFSWQPVPRPTAAMASPTRVFSTSGGIPVGWTTSKVGMFGTVADVRYRSMPALGGPISSFRPLRTGTYASASPFGAAPGTRYCFSVRSRIPKLSLTSSWSTPRCTVVPVDDRALVATGPWARTAQKGWLAGTGSVTTTKGATLTSRSGLIRRAGVVATTCPTCGRIAISVGGTRIGTLSLYSATTQRRLLTVPISTVPTGKVSIVVLSSGKKVAIDGLAVDSWVDNPA